jgi:hypothetical protein
MILATASRALPIGPRSRLAVLLLVLIAVAAGSLVGANTRWGVGLRGDSYAYISGARNLAAGLGYSRISGGGEVRPITHFPPLFSLLLASAEDRALIEALSAGLQAPGRYEDGVILMAGASP